MAAVLASGGLLAGFDLLRDGRPRAAWCSSTGLKMVNWIAARRELTRQLEII